MLRLHREFCEGRDLLGRIYISKQGINAQFSGEEHDALAYTEWVASLPEFSGLHYITDPVEEHQFPKLRLKHRPNLISLAGGMEHLPITQPQARAEKVPPPVWKSMLQQAQEVEVGQDGKLKKKVLVLDVRNSYEWDAGHFQGAERPEEDNFHETPTDMAGEGPGALPGYLKDVDPDTPVMMYCTGGIRCDVYSTYLRKKGFNNLYTLEGGVHNYLRQEGDEGWNGSLFVFDNRLAVPGDLSKAGIRSALAAAVSCSCGSPALLPHANCANLDCNKLFLSCDVCKAKYAGCCCEECVAAPRLLRPFKPEGGHYKSWKEYAADGPKAAEAMAQGRGDGRIARRRKRQQALKKRMQELRAVKLERRQLAKAAVAERQTAAEEQQQQQQEGSSESSSARLERLRQLRERLKSLRVSETSTGSGSSKVAV